MRLRPRKSNSNFASLTTKAGSDSAVRPVLGDVSNTQEDVSNKQVTSLGGGGNVSKKPRPSKKIKTIDSMCESSISNNENNKDHDNSSVYRTELDAISESEVSKKRTRYSSRNADRRVTRAKSSRHYNESRKTEPSAARPFPAKSSLDSTMNQTNRLHAEKRVRNKVGLEERVDNVRSSSTNVSACNKPELDSIDKSTTISYAEKSPLNHQNDLLLQSRVENREEVQPCDLNKCYFPVEYRIERSSYDGTSHTSGIAPMDKADTEDVLMATNYVTDIFQYLYAEEKFSRPRPYMSEQTDINSKMRAILVDWLVEVHMKFRLVPETLYLCVNIIDRYCNLVQVARSRLQLVGVTALLIACKYEEIYPPEVRDCVYITDKAYQRQEVLDMEQDMLKRLRYKITVPTAYPFLNRFLNLVKASPLTRVAANYYMERTLQEHDLLRYRPSLVSASTVVLALLNPDVHLKERKKSVILVTEGTKIILEYTRFKRSELIECSSIIARKIGEEPVTASKRQLVAVKRKFDNKKFQHISTNVDLPSEKFISIQDDTDFERE